MIEFGKTLRETREAKGYTISQVAEKTHILTQIVEGLENENFSRIVAPIYGRGFVKLYCELLGLDPKPMVAEFMEIYSGNRTTVIRMREPAPEPATAIPTVNAPAPTPEPAAEVAPSPVVPPAVEPSAPAPAPVMDFTGINEFNYVPPEPPAKREPPVFDPLANPKPRREFKMLEMNLPDVPRPVWRIGLLAIAALAILTLTFFGIRAVYRASMNLPADEPAAKETAPAATETKAETKAAVKPAEKSAPKATAPRKIQKIKPLYVD